VTRSARRTRSRRASIAPDYDSPASTGGPALQPFDREAAELLGLIEYERKQFEALATIDAFPAALGRRRTGDLAAPRIRTLVTSPGR
jgi:hypothetical protein